MLKNLKALATIVLAIKRFFTFLKKKELKDAAQQSLEEKDQRKLENTLGTGSAPTGDYPGVYERPRKTKG